MKWNMGSLAGLVLALVCAVSAQDIKVVQTTPDLKQALQPQRSLRFGSATKPVLRVVVNDEARFQEIDGFGASFTDSSAWLIFAKLDPNQRDAAMRDLFDPKNGIGLSFIRQPMGSSDLSLNHYSYDDLPAGQKDPELKHFSIRHDEAYILPLLRQARELNPQLKIIASPWSAPGWMKSSDSLIGGTVNRASYPALADYFVKFIHAYERAGVPIYGVTMQNEPLYVPTDYPGSAMHADHQKLFLKEHLGPAFQKAGIEAKVLVYDHNWDHPEYPETIFSDPEAARFAAGTAFHCYGGEVKAQALVHERFPAKGIWETECSGGTWQRGNILAMEARLIIDSTREWARSVVLWNLALDQKNGPNAGGCDTCRGVLTVNTGAPASVTRTLDYYVLGQVSKFVKPGAQRIDSKSFADKLENVAFRNPDGSIVLFALNPGATPLEFEISYRGKTVSYTLPAGAIATFHWSPVATASPQDGSN